MNNHADDRAALLALGSRIRRFRTERSVSQERLADLAGVHRTYIGMVERGEKNFTFLSARKIAAALDITVSQLFEESCDAE